MGAPSPYEQRAGAPQGQNTDESDSTARLRMSLPTPGQVAPNALYDPQYGGFQQQAVAALSNEVNSGGWSDEERKAYERLAAQAQGTAAGQRTGLAQRMAAKGLPAGLAHRIAGEVGQQQDTQMGNAMGIAAQQAANDRAYAAAQGLAGLSQTMQDQYGQEQQFNAGQNLRGILARYYAATGQQYDQQLRTDQQRAQTGQMVGQGIASGASFISAAHAASDSGGDSGRKSTWGTE
jgi:hypothetical protein